MYYIRMVPRTAGSKRDRKARRSIENYNTLEAAKKAMHKFVHEQELLSMRQLGLCSITTKEFDDGRGVVMEIIPAIVLIKGLRLTFSIVEAEME